MKNYYVYLWKNPETNNIFYVGKGKGKRAWNSHANYRSGYKLKSLLSRGHNINSIVLIYRKNLTEKTALKIEDSLIKKYKRIEEGGTLLNYALNGARISSKKKKEIDPKILKDIKELYEQHELTAAIISKKYNVCGETIIRWLRIAGATIRPGNYSRKTIYKHEKEVVRTYNNNCSVAKIGKIYNVCVAVVLKVLKKNNVKLKGRRKKFTSTEIKNIIKQYQAGESSNIIAKMYNVRCCTILRALKENNITVRSNSEAQKCYNNAKL